MLLRYDKDVYRFRMNMMYHRPGYLYDQEKEKKKEKKKKREERGGGFN